MLRFVLIGAVGLLVAADNPKDDAKIEKNSDLQKIHGTWQAASGEASGAAIPEEQIKATKIAFDGNKYTYHAGEYKETGTIKLDASAKPKAMDIHIIEGQGQGEPQFGIYELKGDTLKICFAQPGKEKKRPTEFKSTGEGEELLLVFKRAK